MGLPQIRRNPAPLDQDVATRPPDDRHQPSAVHWLTTASARPSPRERLADTLSRPALLISRAITLATAVITAIIALGVAFFVLGATPTNMIVSYTHEWAKSLIAPFDGMFNMHGAKASLALNWGIALIVYLLLGRLLAQIVLMPVESLRRTPPRRVSY
jgi:hypothetical protein